MTEEVLAKIPSDVVNAIVDSEEFYTKVMTPIFVAETGENVVVNAFAVDDLVDELSNKIVDELGNQIVSQTEFLIDSDLVYARLPGDIARNKHG